MLRHGSIPPFGALLLATLLSISPLLAGWTVDGPTALSPGPDGSFSYDVVFTAGPGGALPAFSAINSGENTLANDLVGDFECLFPYAEGEQFALTVNGSLIDPLAPGSVIVEVGECDGSFYSLETIIGQPATVPTVSQWGLIVMTLLMMITGWMVFSRR